MSLRTPIRKLRILLKRAQYIDRFRAPIWFIAGAATVSRYRPQRIFKITFPVFEKSYV